MQLPEIRLVVGTTYRDLHAEREYLLKRTIPQIKRRCEEQGVLFTLRELKWSDDAEVIALQMNRLLESLAQGDTYYLGIHSKLDPPAPRFSTASMISAGIAEQLESLLSTNASWRQIEEALCKKFLPQDRIAWFAPSDSSPSSSGPLDAERLGSAIEQRILEIIDRVAPKMKGGIENYHQLYLRSRVAGALQSASKADDLMLALGSSQSVLLVGVTGSGKSTTIALALEALSQSGESVIAYVLDGADASSQAVSSHLIRSIGPEAGSNADSFTSLSLALSRAGERIIALDGIEFLEQDARYLGWLPEPLPKNIKLIASTSDQAQAETLEVRGWKIIQVSALEKESIISLIHHLCNERNLWLTPEQKDLIAQHPLSFHPQFLITLIDELGQFGWFAQLKKDLDEYLDEMSIYQLFNSAKSGAAADTSLSNSFVVSARLQHYLQSYSLVELYEKVLERLEFDFGAPQLTRVLGYLGVVTRGLTLTDLVSLTGLTSSSIQHLLNAFGANISVRSGRVMIGNEYFARAIEKRYLGTSSTRNAVRSSLSLYLRTQQTPAHTQELASQYVAAHDNEQLRQLLLDPLSLAYLLEGTQVEALAYYWNTIGGSSEAEQAYVKLLPEYLRIEPLEKCVLHLRNVADLLIYMGRPGAAHAIIEAAIAATAEHNALLLDRAQLLRSLGRTLYSLARYAESEAAYKASYASFTSLGREHEAEALATRKDLASLLAEGARYPEADDLYTEIVRDTERIYGEESPQLASVLNSIGLMLNGQGKYDAAISVAARARNIFVHHWGREYPELGWSYHIFATANRQKGELDEATSWYTLAIERFLQLHGENHPIPLRSMYGLAVLLQRKGDIAGAVVQARKVVQIRTRLLGAIHADTAAAKVLLGSVLKASGEYSEAMTLLAEGLEIFDGGANKEHPEVARTLHELGEVYWKLNMFDRSKAAVSRAIAIRSKVLGNEHPDTLASDTLMHSISAGGELVLPAVEAVKN